MGKKYSKVVRVGYGFIMNQPNNRKIQKTIEKHMKQGYRLVSRQDQNVSCLESLFLIRGRTELTFVQDNQPLQ